VGGRGGGGAEEGEGFLRAGMEGRAKGCGRGPGAGVGMGRGGVDGEGGGVSGRGGRDRGGGWGIVRVAWGDGVQ